MVGLRRPERLPCVGEGRRLVRKRLRRPISIGAKGLSANGRPAPTENTLRVGGGRRPARQRPGRPISNRREIENTSLASAEAALRVSPDEGGRTCPGIRASIRGRHWPAESVAWLK